MIAFTYLAGGILHAHDRGLQVGYAVMDTQGHWICRLPGQPAVRAPHYSDAEAYLRAAHALTGGSGPTHPTPTRPPPPPPPPPPG